MKRLILVCGLPATGKSTSSKLLYLKFDKVGYLDVDAVRSVKFTDDEQDSRLKIKNGADVIRNYFDIGCTEVIAEGLADNQRELDSFFSLLGENDISCTVFVLHADFDVRKVRWNKNIAPKAPPRPLDEVDRSLPVPDFAVSAAFRVCDLETSADTPESIAQKMFDLLKEANEK